MVDSTKSYQVIQFAVKYKTVCQADEADAEQAADLQIQLRRQGWQLATVDALVAAVALRHNLTLLTRDKDFAAISSLKQEAWLES